MISLLRYSAVSLGLILGGTLPPVAAQSYTWRNVEIGGGGFVTGIVFHPTEPGLVYARSDVGGAYRLDTATNRWIALNDDIGGLNNEFQYLGVLTIGLDPSNANRVYLATGQYAGTESWKQAARIYRSTDRGVTWTYTTPGFKMAGNGEGRGTGERMAVDPINGTNILIGTSNNGIWRSTDSGASWTQLPGFSPTSCNFVMYAPANHLNPGPNRRAYASANTLTGQSFWFSDDNGTTWAEMPTHPGKTVGAEMMPLQGSFDAAGVFYSTWGDATGPSNYATHYGVWKLAADGNTWTSILPPTGQGFFSGISADPRVAGHVLATTLERWWPGDEVYRSTDGGTTWVAALRTGTRSAGNSPWSSAVGPHWMTDIEIDPFNSDRAIFNNGFGLIQTTHLSASGTARIWTFFSDGLEELVPLGLHSPTAGAPLVSVVGDYTGFRHDHLDRSPLRGGLSPGSGSTHIICGADLAPSKMIRQNSGTTLYSQDAAATWAAFPTTPPPVVNGHNRAILSADGLHLLWCPPNAPAYVSNDNGASWTIATNTLSAVSTSGTYGVSTLAGPAGVTGTTNASGGSARFNAPSAIALDSSGIRFVADTANHTIRKIAANAAVSTLAGGAGVSGSLDATTTAARFNAPAGVAVDAAQNVWVADTGNHTIRKITSAGVVTTLAGSAGLSGSTDATGTAARFSSPAGMTVNSSGNLFVCDAGNHTIRKITATGVVTTIAGSPGLPGTTNANGTAARFNAPTGIVIDSSGNLYVADSGNHAVRKVTPAGDVTTIAGSAASSGSTDATGTSARFNSPKAITIDAAGTLYVADSGNHCVRKLTAAGVVTTIAGLAATSGTADGTGTAARFNSPAGIAVTPDGFNLYIADTINHTIRCATPYNTLTPLPDRVDGNRLYLWDNSLKRLLTSTDGGTSFSVVATGVNTAFNQFRTVPGKNGHIWAKAGTSGIYQSSNFGVTFSKIAAVAEVYQFDFGKAAPSATYPAIFIWGKVGSITGFFRSDDAGATWVRINDNLHNFGYQNDLAGDPRVYGRLYLATSGRGVVYGDFTNPVAPAPQPSQTVFDDALQNGWTNASTGGTSLVSTSPVYRGSAAISVLAGSAKGISLTCSNRSLQGLAALSFWIHAGAVAPPPLQVGVSRGGIALEAVPITVPATVGWQRVVIPLSQLDLATIDDLTGLRIESRTVNSGTPGAFSLDDITLVITPAPQTINFSALPGRTFGDAAFDLSATATSTLPVTFSIVSGPATLNGTTATLDGAGTVVVRASQPGDSNHLAAADVEQSFIVAKAAATVTLGTLSAMFDGQAKPITATTIPPGRDVIVTYNGSASAPSAVGSYAVVATLNDFNYQGSATDTLVIARRSFTDPVTGWLATNATTLSGADTSSPLLNAGNGSGTSGASVAFFARITPHVLSTVGDTLQLDGYVTVNTPAGAGGQNLWFRFGIFDNPNAADSKTVYNWLGYTAMAQSTAANSLYERIGGTTNGDFASSIFGSSGRTPDLVPAYVGANSPSGVVTLRVDQTITRTAAGVTVVSLLARPGTGVAPDTIYLSSTYTDTTPNNNGISNGTSQTTPTVPVYSPRYDSVGFVFSGAYLNSTNTSSVQFSNAAVTFTPGTEGTPQTIDFPPPPDHTYGDAPINLTATATSGLPASFAVVSGPATLSGNILAITGVGDVTIRASQAGNLTWLPALPVEQTFTVRKAPAAVTLANLNQTYDGAVKSITATTTPPGLQVEILYEGNLVEVGSYSVTAIIMDDRYTGGASGTLVISQPITPLDAWRHEHFQTYDNAANAADSADPDHDGISNLMEFALGLDPTAASVLPVSLGIHGNLLEYTYTRSKSAMTSLSYFVEYCDTLAPDAWTQAGVTEQSPPLADNGVTQTVKVTLPAGNTRRFVRLKVVTLPR